VAGSIILLMSARGSWLRPGRIKPGLSRLYDGRIPNRSNHERHCALCVGSRVIWS